MNLTTDFRDPEAVRTILQRISHTAEALPHVKFMEICGGHTHTIYRHGFEQLLPKNIEMVHGPGCPVCVLPMGRMDDAQHLATQPDVILTAFGDMMRVPGSHGSLLDSRAQGADIRMVYSPLDALAIAKANPNKEIIFFAVGFETTAPSTALTLRAARAQNVKNFTVFCNHVVVGPPIRAILESDDVQLNGFVAPGHVSTIIGQEGYQFIIDEFNKPVVTAGFEPVDLLAAIAMLAEQVADGRCEVENQYTRVVTQTGNRQAQDLLAETFTLRDTFEWRGLGHIPQSAYRVSDDYAEWDTENRFAIPGFLVEDPKACQCGEVLRGALKPWECKVFGKSCTPEHPIGTCMVSSEGACAAYYTFGQYRGTPTSATEAKATNATDIRELATTKSKA